MKMIRGSCKAYNRELDPMIKKSSLNTVKLITRACSKCHICIFCVAEIRVLTGLPDAYGRGRIIGDYRRCAVRYRLPTKENLEQSTSLQADWKWCKPSRQTIRLREKSLKQHRVLGQMKKMAAKYGYDISGL
ncbi:hypothetical protein ACNKHM_02060 [Shigella sonnei]